VHVLVNICELWQYARWKTNNYLVILLGKNFSSTHGIEYRHVLVLRMWNAWTDSISKHWKIRDISPFVLMLVTLRHIYMNRFISLAVRESLFLQLILESHHCMLNETYMFFFQISSSEFTFCLNRKWNVIISYFSLPLANIISAFVKNIEFLFDIIKERERFRVMISQQKHIQFDSTDFPRINLDSK